MGDLERILPEEVPRHARKLPTGGLARDPELVLPYAEALKAIAIASEHRIAVLGVDAFELQKDGLLTVDMVDPSSSIAFSGDWDAYVSAINAEAERWTRQHCFGESHGYLLTSASLVEFGMLPHRIK